MRTIYKFSIIALLSLVGFNAFAQDSPVTFGVKAGVNLINMTGDISDLDYKIAVQGGVTFDYAFNPEFSLISGLELTTKGSKYHGYMTNLDGYLSDMFVNINLMYMQLPVHAAYKMSINPNTKFVFQAGPYVAYGIAGKTTIKDGIEKQSENSFSTGRIKDFDFGFGLGAGLEFGKIVTKLGYEFGVINVMDNETGKLKNRNASLTLGYQF